ncbi:unnamed protein product [Diabrotica balteata]|uniref:Proton-associated sugar transporter A n=1 Tax=Diabrotica balteata TaxID=107213 RepID=A0A9P0E351_DIABA|nr:unnamed protein product [Diabrotica balteata]
MAEKLYEYQGFSGRIHTIRDNLREKYSAWKENDDRNLVKWLTDKCFCTNNTDGADYPEFSHIYRRKTRRELVRVSAAVMGIEFSYAAETAFVSPTLLKIGVEHKHMTLVWALSPLIGFFLTPILGSLSDRCHLSYGRRRPFILLMSVGVLLGLILVPNGEYLGYKMGDTKPPDLYYHRKSFENAVPFEHENSELEDSKVINKMFSLNSKNTSKAQISALNKTQNNITNNDNIAEDIKNNNDTIRLLSNNLDSNSHPGVIYNNSHPWGVLFTIIGTVLLDFNADACQSPARAYLLDVTIPDDHARGLSTFTIMAGLGGFFGYALGGINWDATFIGEILGGHVRAVFTVITVIFIICVASTITSFKEIPLPLLELNRNEANNLELNETQKYGTLCDDLNIDAKNTEEEYIPIEDPNVTIESQKKSIDVNPNISLLLYLQSIIYMPYSIRILCTTNLFCWMAHVCYSLYFTDFVGEAVFNGSPTATAKSLAKELYEDGVRFGCWGMSMYSLSCACYSTKIVKLISVFGARNIYVGGLLVYSIGMLCMAITKHKIGVLLFSWTAGIMYSTLFTMPYLIVAHYHAKRTFEITEDGKEKITTQIRGLGTDVALISSMVFVAQFILSICMGTIVNTTGTITSIVSVASMLAFFGAISASQVMYLDL